MKRRKNFKFALTSILLLLCMVIPVGFNFNSNYVNKQYNASYAVDSESDSGSEISDDSGIIIRHNNNLQEDVEIDLENNPNQQLVNNNAQNAQNNNANANQNANGKMETAQHMLQNLQFRLQKCLLIWQTKGQTKLTILNTYSALLKMLQVLHQQLSLETLWLGSSVMQYFKL